MVGSHILFFVGSVISEQPTFRAVFSSQMSSNLLDYNVVSHPRDHNANIALFQIIKLLLGKKCFKIGCIQRRHNLFYEDVNFLYVS
jgi:hypothetical protein